MRFVPSRRILTVAPAATIVLSAIAALPTEHAFAGDFLGLYVGGAAGQSQVEANVPSIGDFKQNHSAFKLIAGIRPIPLIGAELSYIDFGHPSGSINAVSSNVSEKGADAFGVLYLPVPVVDVFVKAGLARLQSTSTSFKSGVGTCTVTNPNCALFRLDRTNTSFAAGAGAQVKFGPWAVRAEYERFNAAGGNPSLVSLGLTWTFL
ncbi:MAG TPA: outer membrane beta-barrel protein [Steroidobacteraceae bacterium]|nr:outer membrane beta-barrel protein [Steroidobacteraceae bacterium]